MSVTLIDLPQQIGGTDPLQVDRFGLSIGSVSVGLPIVCTGDDVLRRYLDLLRILQTGPSRYVEPPAADIAALAIATRTHGGSVARRLAVLQSTG